MCIRDSITVEVIHVGYVWYEENCITIKIEFITISTTKMADNNESSNIENTATESLVLNEPQANSTPIINNKVSLEDLFQLMKIQNGQLNNKLNQFDDKLNQFDEQFNDIKKEIKKQSCNFDERINEIEIQCDSIQKQTENSNEQFNNKISQLDDKIKQINETVQNQIEIQCEKIENKCLTTLNKQIESKTNFETNKKNRNEN